MPECAPVSTHPGQEGLREAGSGAKTGLEEPHGQRSPVTCLALDAKRALCSPSLTRRNFHEPYLWEQGPVTQDSGPTSQYLKTTGCWERETCQGAATSERKDWRLVEVGKPGIGYGITWHAPVPTRRKCN